MAQSTQETDFAPDLKPSPADALRDEHDHLRALRRRLETATEALIRVSDQLTARAPWSQGCKDDRKHDGADAGEPDPDGGRP